VRDPEALGAFFDHHMPRIYTLAFRLVGDVHAAEDLTQEAFYRAFRAIERLDPARDPVPWLVAITYNAWRDQCRSGARRLGLRSQSIDDSPRIAQSLVAEGADPERGAVKAEAERAVQDAIGELPEHLRVVVLLHDYTGLSHEVIADSIGASHAAVRKRYSRALAMLGRRLRSLDL
jgi:RNA polymerase sigma-70 factor (ECF subfamily)